MKSRLTIASLLMALALCACQDQDAQMVLKTLNEDPRLVSREVHVKKVRFGEKRREGEPRPYEADILNKDGKVVGKAEGRRVENFGTVRPRIQWTDPALADKSLDPPEQNINTRMKQRIMEADANGDGRVTFEEAAAADSHLMKPAFDYFDRNGDGAVSAEDDTYEGPNRNRRLWRGNRREGGGSGNRGGQPE